MDLELLKICLCSCIFLISDREQEAPIFFTPASSSQYAKLIDPLLILYVCPLTKKWSVYNFNGIGLFEQWETE